MEKSELLLPVGNMEMCLAAIHGGADAIYVGMPGFNARGRTVDHSIEQLKEIIELCHLYGVKVHVAFNILIFEAELESAMSVLKEVLPLSPDALIVQDLGLATLVRQMCPDQVIHASTQMTVTNPNAIELIDDLNIQRFVLGRENSLDEIKEIRKATDKELEVFVHGALCVAYSGQCFTSESIGGRSANRGQCAQSCRFGYDLIVDGQKKQLVDKKYLVSPQDLCGINEVKDLQEIGVESFKVEGRLKSAAFVGTVAKTYKSAINGNIIEKEDIDKMAMTYSRGFFSGWLHGVDHQQLVKGNYKSHRGVSLGRVKSISEKGVTINSTKSEVTNGMGVVICDDIKETELGSPIFSVTKNRDSSLTLDLSKDFDLSKVKIGDLIYLNSSPELAKEVDASVKDIQKQKKISIALKFEAVVGDYAKLSLKDEDGNEVEVKSENTLELAQREPDLKKITKDLLGFSRTIYNVQDHKIQVSKPYAFLHSKELKKLRQQATAKLNELRVAPRMTQFSQAQIKNIKTNDAQTNTINILLREIAQVKDLEKTFKEYQGHSSLYITLDFEFGKDYREALDILNPISGIKVGIATNRILKPKEYHHLNLLTRLELDFILARNLGAFQYLKLKKPELEIRGDFSLNVANSQTANYLLNKGFSALTTSYDLNAQQATQLLEQTDASKMEITVHQYMPSFHMEHCVFAAFLSKGSSFKDCGKPCEKHQVELKDQFGNHHFIKADQECRNTMFNATAQSAISLIPQFSKAGVKNFRIEMLNEKGEELINKLGHYLNYFEGNEDIDTLLESVNSLEKYGLGSGQLMKEDSYQDRKQ